MARTGLEMTDNVREIRPFALFVILNLCILNGGQQSAHQTAQMSG